MDNVCRICGKESTNLTALHGHLKAHKVSQAAYYQQYFPRHDKFDGHIILFKNRDFYFTADFNSKANLSAWLKKVSKEDAIDYVQQFLLTRKARKNLKYTPTQAELRSLPIPGMVYLNKLLGNYYAFCSDLGLVNRFSQTGFLKAKKRFNGVHHILCDTREQHPLSFPTVTRHYEGLKFGDYRLNDDDFTHNCCIERKSLSDFYTTVSSGYIRFIKEIERAQEAGFYLVVLVESPFDSIYSFQAAMANIASIPSPEYVFHNMREISQKYPLVQFLFVENREESARAIERIFQSDGEYKNVDLQYLYDTKQLI